ncbi:TPA: hypothetical protein ACMDWR_003646 [Vibrio cholerae]|uniref:hypothetical protein n=1 Tax=Vibrio cholerae TaxID=666 RepID=UPI001582E240|nr:hypothetical protein [Vibrio cholerae]EHD2271247.1 hypothetical protein [Vibrio cholerae]EIC2299331.1 hypothetical protein [Vibrio cholerae]EIF8949879.1 hypothetical protein [Vibrio cholerae]EIJ2221300.1 hypothetical protein [Vibrio cholerae]EJL6695727.1 hypothetical protein [Vibrio cholerae]
MDKNLGFDPKKSLIELKILWLVVGGFGALAAFVTLIIGMNSDLIPNYSYLGFNHAVVVFRVPLAILALIIPIVALLAANHRSVQTKEQIRVANEQNNFSNYYKHIEEFEKYLNKIWDKKSYTSSPRKLHKVLFPNARHGDFSISTSIWVLYDSMVSKFAKQTAELTKCEPSDQPRILVEMQGTIRAFADTLYLISYEDTSGGQLKHNDMVVIIKDNDVRCFIEQVQIVTQLVDNICAFELAYEASEKFNQVLKINFASLPSSKVYQGKIKRELDLSELLNAA